MRTSHPLAALALLLSALEPARANAACPATAAAIEEGVDKAFAAFEDMDAAAFGTARSELLADLSCLGELVTPQQAAGVHRVEALHAFMEARHDEVRAALIAAARADPRGGLPEELAPAGHPLRAAQEVAGGPNDERMVGVDVPAGATLYVDGARSLSRSGGWPAVVVVVTAEGVAWSGYLVAGAPMPELPSTALSAEKKGVQEGPSKPRLVWDLLFVGGLYSWSQWGVHDTTSVAESLEFGAGAEAMTLAGLDENAYESSVLQEALGLRVDVDLALGPRTDLVARGLLLASSPSEDDTENDRFRALIHDHYLGVGARPLSAPERLLFAVGLGVRSVTWARDATDWTCDYDSELVFQCAAEGEGTLGALPQPGVDWTEDAVSTAAALLPRVEADLLVLRKPQLRLKAGIGHAPWRHKDDGVRITAFSLGSDLFLGDAGGGAVLGFDARGALASGGTAACVDVASYSTATPYHGCPDDQGLRASALEWTLGLSLGYRARLSGGGAGGSSP